MKRLRIAAIVLLCLPGPAIAAPQRIMSLSICTDELLLDLVGTERIASLTFMSREPASLRQWPQALPVPTNRGSAEEVLRAKPDLVLADSFLSATMRSLLAKSGAPTVLIPPAQNFPQIRAVTRIVAQAVGDPARGERLIAQMDAALRTLAARRPSRPVRALEWGSGGYVPGAGGLFDAMLTAAGGANIEKNAMDYYDVEALLAANPQVLVYGDTYRGMNSLRADQDLHPALTARFRRITYPSLYGCGIPQAAQAALQMQQGLIAAAKKPKAQ